MSVNLSTVKKWILELDSVGEWLRHDESGGKVSRIICALCSEHKERLHALRNFSSSFIDGITGTALKKDIKNIAIQKLTTANPPYLCVALVAIQIKLSKLFPETLRGYCKKARTKI